VARLVMIGGEMNGNTSTATWQTLALFGRRQEVVLEQWLPEEQWMVVVLVVSLGWNMLRTGGMNPTQPGSGPSASSASSPRWQLMSSRTDFTVREVP